jgi:ppGpp synthetase/RelA/SpoT-type nucleotidyltranferase
MAREVLRFTKSQVDAAGIALTKTDLSLDEYDAALAVINNWRAAHSFPLNTFQIWLKRRSREVHPDSLVAQRIKRLASIDLKISRFPSIRLSQMQDIGGCRAVVETIDQVNRIVDLYKTSDLRHKLDHMDDYIQNPRNSGYRGVHLIYRYFSDRKESYNGLKIEVQLRSTLQHAWATAVETVGTFTRQALKSSLGEEAWLRFFALMGTAIALREKTPLVPGTPTSKHQLRRELLRYSRLLDVEGHLHTYGQALQTLESAPKRAHYYLLVLDPIGKTVRVTGYQSQNLHEATRDYLSIEREIANTGSDAVLVSVESLAALRRAYPNYFLDTHVFISAVKHALRLH